MKGTLRRTWLKDFWNSPGKRGQIPGPYGREAMLRGYLDVGAVLVGVLDMWEPVSWRFAEVFGLRDEPQHLGPAWAHTPTHTQTKQR